MSNSAAEAVINSPSAKSASVIPARRSKYWSKRPFLKIVSILPPPSQIDSCHTLGGTVMVSPVVAVQRPHHQRPAVVEDSFDPINTSLIGKGLSIVHVDHRPRVAVHFEQDVEVVCGPDVAHDGAVGLVNHGWITPTNTSSWCLCL